MTVLVIILAIGATVATVAWFVLNRQNPEQAATHTQAGTDERPNGTADRPAGPDAETMDPDQLGGDHRPPT